MDADTDTGADLDSVVVEELKVLSVDGRERKERMDKTGLLAEADKAFSAREVVLSSMVSAIRGLKEHARTIWHPGYQAEWLTVENIQAAASCFVSRNMPPPDTTHYNTCVFALEHFCDLQCSEAVVAMFVPLGIKMLIAHEANTLPGEADFGLAAYPVMRQCLVEIAAGQMTEEQRSVVLRAAHAVLVELEGWASWLDMVILMAVVTDSPVDNSMWEQLVKWSLQSEEYALVQAVETARKTGDEESLFTTLMTSYDDEDLVKSLCSAIMRHERE